MLRENNKKGSETKMIGTIEALLFALCVGIICYEHGRRMERKIKKLGGDQFMKKMDKDLNELLEVYFDLGREIGRYEGKYGYIKEKKGLV